MDEPDDAPVHEDVGGGCCAGPASLSPLAGKRSVNVMSVFAQPATVAAPGGAASGEQSEMAWLALHDWLFLFYHTPNDSPPYAFASLHQVVLRELDSVGFRIQLALVRRRPGVPIQRTLVLLAMTSGWSCACSCPT